MIQKYLSCGFPLIPLAKGSKCPAARQWQHASFGPGAFAGRNVGTRVGERVCVNGKEGHLLIVDFDSPDLPALRRLCASIPLERTTCVRTGGNHAGYHLFYLTAGEVRKHGLLSFEGTSVDLLGKGGYAVVPPSVVDRPYTFLVGLDEIAVLGQERYDRLLEVLSAWKRIETLLQRVRRGRIGPESAAAEVEQSDAPAEARSYFGTQLSEIERCGPPAA